MGKIGYGYGSEWHLLRYLGYHRNKLTGYVLQETGGLSIRWLDFEFTNKNNRFALDAEWKGLDFISDTAVQHQWSKFWPQTGNPPNWDAIGKLKTDHTEEWLLIEAKAHADELKSRCGASVTSRATIKLALIETQLAFNSKVPVEQWLKPYYQYCNRLAVLNFLTQVCTPPIPARLVFIYFYGDANPSADCPQSPSEWRTMLETVYQTIDLDPQAELHHRVHTVYLPVTPHLQR